MTLPLMPKATAVWLIENTHLSFDQIAAFCGIHPIEIQAIADGESAVKMLGLDPVASGQLTQSEIERCEANLTAKLVLSVPVDASTLLKKKREGKYTPLSKRQERPDAIAWILKYHPEIPDAGICKLLGTTKITVQAIKNRTHRNSVNIKPKNPVILGLCTQTELDELIREFYPESAS